MRLREFDILSLVWDLVLMSRLRATGLGSPVRLLELPMISGDPSWTITLRLWLMEVCMRYKL